ncbi:MAG: phage holin family protein [Lachnospiraceae bacterium]|nr:phage holin family protein [Lachnospiraceae bacterium]
MNTRLTVIKLTVATFGGIMATFWKTYGAIILLVAIAIVFDVITGLIKAGSKGEITPKSARVGFWKKCAEIFALGFGMYIDYAIPTLTQVVGIDLHFRSPFALIIGVYIIVNETISILSNITSVNSNLIPKWVSKLFKQAKKNIDEMGDKNV